MELKSLNVAKEMMEAFFTNLLHNVIQMCNLEQFYNRLNNSIWCKFSKLMVFVQKKESLQLHPKSLMLNKQTRTFQQVHSREERSQAR